MDNSADNLHGVAMTETSWLWEVLHKIVWPALLVYGGYLHKRIFTLEEFARKLQEQQHKFETETFKQYATREAVDKLESRLVTMLARIDDKVDRILERNK